MTDPDTISTDHTLRPNELADTLGADALPAGRRRPLTPARQTERAVPGRADGAGRTTPDWGRVSGIVNQRGNLDRKVKRALFRGTVGEPAGVEFSASLNVWREMPHPRTVIDGPENAIVPDNASALPLAPPHGRQHRAGPIATYPRRLRRDVSGSGGVQAAPLGRPAGRANRCPTA